MKHNKKIERSDPDIDHSHEAVTVFNEHAGIYQQKYMDQQHYAQSLDLMLSHLSTNAEILDLGCGPGNITRYLLRRRPDLKILGIDLSENMICLAKENNPAASFEKMDIRNLHLLMQKFDAIICGFCLPYLGSKEAAALIGHAARLLKKNGISYLSTMEGNYRKSGYHESSTGSRLFIRLYDEKYLSGLLRENDLEVMDVNRVVYFNFEGSPTTDLVIVARK